MSEALSQQDVLKLGQLLNTQNGLLRDLIVRNIEQTTTIKALEERIDQLDARLDILTNAMNTNARQTRAVLQNAARAASRSQELDVRGLATPIPAPPKPHGR